MLNISGLSRSFASQTVFDSATWFVPPHARVGLVGPNGSGKSTLLRMIAGLEDPDDGAIVFPRGTTVGYLPQEAVGLSGRTILEEALDAFAGIRAVEQECRRLEEALAHTAADDPQHDALLAAYTDAREHWDTHGSYDLDSRAFTVLSGLGFSEKDFSRDAGEFSGGWQMRLALAKLLLQQPDLLLLDEPTNHLDLEARNWLEEFLADYPFTVILVAHDRYFLDVAVDRIAEVSHGKLVDYQTTYSRYLVQKAENQARALEAYRLQQEEIERVEAFINRFRYQASKATLVQSRVKQLEKVERLPMPEGVSESLHFRLAPCARSGRIVLELTQATKHYGDLVVYSGIDLAIERGRKVALVGPNGAGKSTLIKMLAGVEPLSGGTRQLGHSVLLGYFAQDQSNVLDPDKTVLDEITAAATYDTVSHVRDLLGAFLFRGDSVRKRTKVLSGGERNRLALAKLLVRPSNCLLLDEPTNHLDIAAKEVLLEALQQYSGTLILVAHDRYLLDHLPDEIIEVGAGHATRYLGNYEDYLRQKAVEATGGVRPTPPAPRPEPTERVAVPKSQQPDRNKPPRPSKAAAQRERSLAQLERDIADKERNLAELSAVINASDFYTSHTNPHGIFSQYALLKKEVETLYEKLERLEQQPAEA